MSWGCCLCHYYLVSVIVLSTVTDRNPCDHVHCADGVREQRFLWSVWMRPRIWVCRQKIHRRHWTAATTCHQLDVELALPDHRGSDLVSARPVPRPPCPLQPPRLSKMVIRGWLSKTEVDRPTTSATLRVRYYIATHRDQCNLVIKFRWFVLSSWCSGSASDSWSKVAGSTPSRGAIKIKSSTQPSIPLG